MAYRFYMVCPSCNRTAERIELRSKPAPTVSCGDCLMDRTEVVHLKVVSFEEIGAEKK
jgi:hypothetical protein